MLPSGLVITVVAFAIALGLNRLSLRDRRWFMQLRRPAWLTFEWAIPLIWLSIFAGGIVSATLTWNANPGTGQTWALMAGYLIVELAIMAYTPVMCRYRSLTIGTAIVRLGFVLGCFLTWQVGLVDRTAALWLLPYLLWSPIGTFVTWQMIRLNPESA